MTHGTIRLDDVIQETKKFFALHWPTNEWGDQPNWEQPWYLHGTMPNTDKQGVYALINDSEEVIYIGVGAAFGFGNYEGCGLGARTARYTRVAPKEKQNEGKERQYIPSPEWSDRRLVAIATLGIDSEKAYLAYALEAYLLSIFCPPFNKVRSARRTN